MRELQVYIEWKGNWQLAGIIKGENHEDAGFCYADEYLSIADIRPISIQLPLQKEPFRPEQTRCFFEGLLPEGFSRKAVANWMKADENDYLTILEKLGQECLGAICIQSKETNLREATYEPLSDEQVYALASEGATKSTEVLMDTHLSLTGASGKAGLYYDSAHQKWYLPRGSATSTHIVKQSHIRLGRIVLNEQLCMLTAKKMGIDVPDSFIINLGEAREQDVLYATARYDRDMSSQIYIDNLQCPYRLHQEDFSQALGIPSAEKYETKYGSYLKRMFKLLNDFSSNPVEDRIKLWNRIVFNYLIGNTDCHVKNFSLLYSSDLKSIRLAPAYDIVCTRMYGTTNEMSFYIGGELDITNMNRDTFVHAANEVGLGQRLAMKNYDRLSEQLEGCIDEAADELFHMGFQDAISVRDAIKKAIF
ncbi:MAG: type II toxin-antitoxin system HipA family toxin [Wujia sp.]